MPVLPCELSGVADQACGDSRQHVAASTAECVVAAGHIVSLPKPGGK
jgi:hypothetical protein